MVNYFYYATVLIGAALTCIAFVFLLKKPFFKLAVSSAKQLDLIMDATLDEDEKDKRILQNLGNVLLQLFLSLFLSIVCIVIGIIPGYVFVSYSDITPDVSSLYFYLSMSTGSLVLFLFTSKKKSDYGYWSKLLHTIVLDNYSLGRYLFKREVKKLKKSTSTDTSKPFVVVTGLARAGTTALTNLLYDEKYFHSISYANMPFLMAPKFWKKLYNPKNAKKKERAHKDSVLFSQTSIEALEEYFFKAKTGDSYIAEDTMTKHEVSAELYNDYRLYQELFKQDGKDTLYLAKNNNFILKYASLREYDKTFKVILMFREPLAHATSLLRQHQQFCQSQKDDPFVLQYMDWLGHHEFGLHQKVFDFGDGIKLDQTDKMSINYWLAVWIHYYQYIMSLDADPNLTLVHYDDLLNRPNHLKNQLATYLGTDVKMEEQEAFTPNYQAGVPNELDQQLYDKAKEIYQQLLPKALTI